MLDPSYTGVIHWRTLIDSRSGHPVESGLPAVRGNAIAASARSVHVAVGVTSTADRKSPQARSAGHCAGRIPTPLIGAGAGRATISGGAR